MSYNAEGIIPESTIEDVLREWGLPDSYHRYAMTYKRYRSDSDSAHRQYRGDRVHEFLYCVSRA
jgi:adenine-specific DNA methylase